MKETWEILGQRAIPGLLSSTIVGNPSEYLIFGVKVEGSKTEEVRNVFEAIGSLVVEDLLKLNLLGTKSAYLEKEFYSFGSILERQLKEVPVIGKKLELKTAIYEFVAKKTSKELTDYIIKGATSSKELNELFIASGKVSQLQLLTGVNVEGIKTSSVVQEKTIKGKKSFKALLEALLIEV